MADAVITMEGNPERENAESDLLALAKRGNLDAFERIVMLHERRVYALAVRITGNPEDAKDATQEAFLRLHRHIAQIDADRSAGPWLCRVVVNACRDIGRDHQRSRLVPMEEWTAVSPECSTSPESLASDRERERHLQLGLRRLPEKERAALLLREMEGLSTEEVARVLDSSAATVRSQICMARIKLRKFFAQRLGNHKLGKRP